MPAERRASRGNFIRKKARAHDCCSCARTVSSTGPCRANTAVLDEPIMPRGKLRSRTFSWAIEMYSPHPPVWAGVANVAWRVSKRDARLRRVQNRADAPRSDSPITTQLLLPVHGDAALDKRCPERN